MKKDKTTDDVICCVGNKCLCNFGDGDGNVLRVCEVVKINSDNTYNVIAYGMGWKMDNIPMVNWRPYSE